MFGTSSRTTSGLRPVKGRCHRLGSHRPHVPNPLPLVRICDHYGRKAAETRQQRLSTDTRKSGHTGECGFGSRKAGFALRPLCVRRGVAKPEVATPIGEPVQPEGRVPSSGGAHDVDSEIHHRNADASDRSGQKRSIVQIALFDQHVRKCGGLPKPPDLCPEPTLNHRRVEPADGLALDDSPAADVVLVLSRREST